METSKFVEGVNIINQYLDEDHANLAVGHDQIFFGSSDLKMEQKDIDRLIEIDWFIDEESWSCFV